MFRSHVRLNPATTVSEVQQAFNYSDEYLARRCDVPVETVRNWRCGHEHPSSANLRQMRELLRLNKALNDARAGTYRQA